MRVLIVEDDQIIGSGLVQSLTNNNYTVDWVETVASAQAALVTQTYDILILDIGLPDGSGLDILYKLRRENNQMPVLILTAYDEISSKISGLDAGADDYLIKPFDLNELLARMRALRRRSNGSGSPVLQIGDVVLDPVSHKVLLDNEEVELGAKEFAILHALMEKPERLISKAQLEDTLYGWNAEIESNTVEVHIHGIRKKLGKNIIRTVRHAGYQIKH
ncbi:response regulator [Agarilytica rhodophyticola]|uniref:response regulator n=1 Tax=Agarilytica rhodophyticola TaxID=1737490 RepID=UPI000B348947|nr:response regulator [Agarilytica rhodophyticola]